MAAYCGWWFSAEIPFVPIHKSQFSQITPYHPIRHVQYVSLLTPTVARTLRYIIQFTLVAAIVRSLQRVLTERVFLNLDIMMQTIAYSSFYILPVVYYHMDPGYPSYIRSLLARNRISPRRKSISTNQTKTGETRISK